MDFKKKSIVEVGLWLKEDMGFGDNIVDVFRGMLISLIS